MRVMEMGFDNKLTGAEMIRVERERQIFELGYTAEHDDTLHAGNNWDLYYAAVCYRDALDSSAPLNRHIWPFEPGDWKPGNRLSNLVRAGALYQANADAAERRGEHSLKAESLDGVKTMAAWIDGLLWRRRMGLPFWAEDAVKVQSSIRLDLRGILALILAGGRLSIRATVYCQNKPGRTDAEVTADIERPGPARTAELKLSESPRNPLAE